jgi:hypothetical protein
MFARPIRLQGGGRVTPAAFFHTSIPLCSTHAPCSSRRDRRILNLLRRQFRLQGGGRLNRPPFFLPSKTDGVGSTVLRAIRESGTFDHAWQAVSAIGWRPGNTGRLFYSRRSRALSAILLETTVWTLNC